MLKKIKFIFMAGIIAILSMFNATVLAAEDITVILDGKQLTFDVLPQFINERTMVPLRTIFEAMGATVHWNDSTQTVTASKDLCRVNAKINDPVMIVNGTPKTMDVAPVLKDERTLIPARFVAEAFGAEVSWDENTSTVNIVSAKAPSYIPERRIYTEGYTKATNISGMQNMFTVSTNSTDMISVPLSDVEYYKKICWYTVPTVVMYAADGTTTVIPKVIKEDYIKNGWLTHKNEIDLQSNRNRINSLVYDSSKTGSLTGTITYQYNEFVGTKPDVGAEVMLIQTNHIPLDSDSYNLSSFNNENDPTIYVTKVDGMGHYYIDYVPVGDYYLFIKSENAREAPNITPLNMAMIETFLYGQVTNKGLDNIKSLADSYCFAIEIIEIKENQIFRYSEDWGYSY